MVKKLALIILVCVVCINVKSEESIPNEQPYKSITESLYRNDSIAGINIESAKFMLVDTIVMFDYATYSKHEDVVFIFPSTTPTRKLSAKYLLHNKDSYFLMQYLSAIDSIARVRDISSDKCMWEWEIHNTLYGLVYLIRSDWFDLYRVPVYDRKTFPCARRRMKYYRAILPVCEDFYKTVVRSGRPIPFYRDTE